MQYGKSSNLPTLLVSVATVIYYTSDEKFLSEVIARDPLYIYGEDGPKLNLGNLVL